MPAEWKAQRKRFKPQIVLDRIAAARNVAPTGSVSFSGFALYECLPTLHSMLRFPDAAAHVDTHSMLWQAVSQIDGALTPAALLTTINQLLTEQLATRERAYMLVTALSLDSAQMPLQQTVLGCKLRFGRCSSQQLGDAHRSLADEHIDTVGPQPPQYLRVSVRVSAKAATLAYNKAMEAVDVFRALLCLMGNSVLQIDLGNRSVAPINVVRHGNAQTVHSLDPQPSEPLLWFDRGYVATKNHRFSKHRIVRKNLNRALRQISTSNFRISLVESLVRFSRALDHGDPSVAFLRLWSALECLASPGVAEYDKLVQRISFLFVDSEYHRQVLEHLRDYRNTNVHDAAHSDQARIHCFQLQFYYSSMVWFCLRNARKYHSLAEMHEFLELPADKLELKRRSELLKRAIRFTTPRP